MGGTTRTLADDDDDDDVVAGDGIGTRIGPYRVEAVLGRGGMGEVVLGVRVDGQFEQRVAIKRIRRGLDSAEVLRRFQAERRILASLKHPNIAAVLDGGITGDDRPYFVMELVESAEPIDVYCERKKLPLSERLALFQVVCGAVESAHQSLIVHRDLKPSNIVVSVAGEVKLLDFGVAKLLDPSLDDELTRTGLVPMTPSCASPEQARGEPVTTASDVYALGVLLYRLLCGAAPYELAGLTLPTQVELITQAEPEKPSVRVKQLRGSREAALLRGELDNITRMAMRKDPRERYASVAALAEDVARFLRHEPIRARSETPIYVARKFVRRHRVAVAVASLLFVSLGAGVVGTAWQARVARSERDRAQAEARKAERITALVTDLLESADPFQAEGAAETPVREIIERGEEKIRANLAGEPALLADVLAVLTRAYTKLGLLERAQASAERVLELRREVFAERSKPVADALAGLASVLVLTEFPQAVEPARASLAIRGELGLPEDAEAAETMRTLATALVGSDDAESSALFDRALAAYVSRRGADSVEVAETLGARASSAYVRGTYQAAADDLRRAIDVRKRLGGTDELATARLQNDLAATLERLGDDGGSEEALASILAIYRRRLGTDHPETLDPLINLGGHFYRRGMFLEARAKFREALEIAHKARGRQHSSNALILSNIGVTASMLGDLEEAESSLREALEIRIGVVGHDHGSVPILDKNLGTVLVREGKLDEAALALETALASSRRVGQDRLAETVCAELARLYVMRGELAKAAKMSAEALASRAEHPPAQEFSLSLSAVAVLLAEGNAEAALAEATIGVERSSVLPEHHYMRDFALAHLAAAKIAAGDPEGAAMFAASRGALVKALGESHWAVTFVDRLVPSD